MRMVRGLILGFATGVFVGVILYLRAKRRREGVDTEDLSAEPKIEITIEEPYPLEEQGAPPQRSAREPDELEQIRGIGPTYAQRLAQAGVKTFDDLAAMEPDRVRDILGPTSLPVDPEAWIAEAGERSKA